MDWLRSLAAEFAITLADPTVWLSIGQGLLVGAVCLVFGVWVARLVGLLDSDAPAGETLGVGLASGLLVLAAWWAAIWSRGQSSFTPVAVGFALAIGLAVARRRRAGGTADPEPHLVADETSAPRSGRRRNLIVAILGGGLFVVAVALLYGSTIALRPRDGVQPLEFQDEAYYSVLGADVAATGTETIYSPSGFTAIEGLPVQTWYHWGEMWLEAGVISILGMAPLDARHFVVLPLLLLATAALTGTVVRRVTGSSSRGAFLFGFLACLFLAPVPLIPGPNFSSWAVGLLFGIRMYGLAAVAVVLALFGLAVLGRRPAMWTLATFVGSAAALILPAHVAIAVLGLVGLGGAWVLRIGQSLTATRRFPQVAPVWQRTFVATGIAIAATVTWGVLSGHGLGGTGPSPIVAPFNASWRESVAITAICSGGFLAIAIAWVMVRRVPSIEASLYVGTTTLLVAGALVWGALLGDFSMFHLFFGGIAVFATPTAAVAVWSVWLHLRATGRVRLALLVLVLSVIQIEFDVGLGVLRLWRFGPGLHPPVPGEILAGIRSLPADAKLAYACQPMQEAAFWDPNLLALAAHTGRRIVPMCFQADVFGREIVRELREDIPSPNFKWAPQRSLYADSRAQPSAASVAAFLRANGIEYIYADAVHPNTLVPDAIPIAGSGDIHVLRLP